MKNILRLASLAIPAVLVACGGGTPKTDTTPATPPATPPASTGATTTTAAIPGAGTTATPTETTTPPAATGPAATFKLTGFATPESVLYDEANDRYLVSNINGKPTDGTDNNGYISVVSTDGKMTTEKWIAGGQNKVTLNGPKGSAIVAGVLYVADVDTVRMFDLKTGAAKGEVKIPGSTFLNDVAAGPDGKIYVTDSGLKMGASGLEGNGTDAVYAIEKGKVKTIAKDASLGKPNGIMVGPTGLWIVTFGSGELYRLDDKGKKQDVTKLPKGSLDGIAMIGDMVYVSSWEGSNIYKGKPGGTFEVAISNVKSPADFGYDKKHSRIVVPLFMENTVEAYDVK